MTKEQLDLILELIHSEIEYHSMIKSGYKHTVEHDCRRTDTYTKLLETINE